MAALASSLTAAASRMISSIGRVVRSGHPGLSALQRAPQRAAAAQPLPPPLPPLRAWLARRPLSSSAAPLRPPRAAASQPDFADVDVALPTHCSGCGVPLQQEDPNAAGFFQVPRKLLERLAAEQRALLGGGSGEGDEPGLEGLEAFEEDDSELVFDDVGPEAYKDEAEEPSTSGRDPEEEAKWSAFDAMVESWLGGSKPKVEIKSYAEEEEEGDTEHVLCARCYSLRHYGQVKSAAAEGALPDFDFERKVGRKIELQKFRRSVVLCVVDVADFDGSLPRAALRSILPDDLRDATSGRYDGSERPLPLGFRLIVAVNKADLLPKQVTQARLERWVRKRMAQGGLPRPSAVHIVSSTKGKGVRELLADLQAAVGIRGDVWVMGAQNAGKSSLINAMRQAARLPKEKDVTTAPLPGTTLGMLRVGGLLPTGCKMLDTPGVPHAHQLARHLTADEMRMVLPRRALKPRTFRIGAGQTVMIGGLARVDVLETPGATLYLTVFASDEVGCHMGKTETAEERYALHAGGKLAPPLGGADRMESWPGLIATDVEVAGDSWKGSSADVAIAGLGWVGVGVNGVAALRVWAPPGVAITTHDALVPDFARDLERPGFGAVLTDAGKNRREEEAKQFKAEKQAAAKLAKRKETGGRRANKAAAASGGKE